MKIGDIRFLKYEKDYIKGEELWITGKRRKKFWKRSAEKKI